MDESTNNEMFGKWRQFIFLLVIFFASSMASEVLFPNHISDTRANWELAAAISSISLSLFIATYWIFRRPGRICKIQALILWLFFGTIFIGATCGLYESYAFLHRLW